MAFPPGREKEKVVSCSQYSKEKEKAEAIGLDFQKELKAKVGRLTLLLPIFAEDEHPMALKMLSLAKLISRRKAVLLARMGSHDVDIGTRSFASTSKKENALCREAVHSLIPMLVVGLIA